MKKGTFYFQNELCKFLKMRQYENIRDTQLKIILI